MLEFLLEPLIDTTYFGCPDSCIEQDSETHLWLKILFSPLVLIGISAGATFGALFATGKLSRFALKDPMKKMIEKSKTKEPKSIKDLEHAIRKEKKQDFLEGVELDQDPFEKFVEMQDKEHPVSNNLEAVRTEAKDKEIIVPEQKLVEEIAEKEKLDLEEQAKQVAKLMEEGLTEDEAVERVITENEIATKKLDLDVITDPKEYQETVDEIDDLEDRKIFEQDNPPPKLPKRLRKLEKHFSKKKKKQFKWNLNELGVKRRDEYAEQIELKLNKFTFPLPKYAGKNQEMQKTDEEVKIDLKKLALFLSMGELMRDKKRAKKMYWEKTLIAT